MATKKGSLDVLAQRLGIDRGRLSALESLPAKRQAELGAAVDEAQSRQRAELDAAIEKALGHVPMLLRRPVLKILRG